MAKSTVRGVEDAEQSLDGAEVAGVLDAVHPRAGEHAEQLGLGEGEGEVGVAGRRVAGSG